MEGYIKVQTGRKGDNFIFQQSLNLPKCDCLHQSQDIEMLRVSLNLVKLSPKRDHFLVNAKNI